MTFVLLANGQGYERYTYDAFGKPKIMDWNGNVRARSEIYNPFMFQGREYLAELGIYDYRHRYYQPELGRFLQMDPMGFDAGDMNLFRYCGDDPVDKADPSGLVVLDDINKRLAVFETDSSSQGGLADLNQRQQLDRQFNEAAERFDAHRVEATRALDSRLRTLIPNGIGNMIKKVEDFLDKFSSDAIKSTTAVVEAFLDHRIAVGQPISFRNNNPMVMIHDLRTQVDRIFVNPMYLSHRHISASAFASQRLQTGHVPSLLAHEGAHIIEPFSHKDQRGEIFARGVQREFDAAFGVNSFREYGSD